MLKDKDRLDGSASNTAKQGVLPSSWNESCLWNETWLRVLQKRGYSRSAGTPEMQVHQKCRYTSNAGTPEVWVLQKCGYSRSILQKCGYCRSTGTPEVRVLKKSSINRSSGWPAPFAPVWCGSGSQPAVSPTTSAVSCHVSADCHAENKTQVYTN